GAVEEVSRTEIDRLRGELSGEAKAAEAAHERWARWFFADPQDRAISPGSSLAFKEYLARLRRSSRIEDLQEALRLVPSDALTHARMGLLILEDLARRKELDPRKEVDRGLRSLGEHSASWYAGRAVELAGKDPEVRALQAEVLVRLGRKAE